MVSDPVGTIRTSIDGTEKMLQLAVEKKVREHLSIFLQWKSTDSRRRRAGQRKKDLGYVDIETVRSCYPEGKRMCECMCTAYAAQYGVNVISARLAQTFGAGNSSYREPCICTVCKKCSQWREYCPAYDRRIGRKLCIYGRCNRCDTDASGEGRSRKAYNIANEESHITIRNMAELVAKEIAGSKIQAVIDIPEDSESLGYAPPVKMWLDASKMRALGWKPEVGSVDAYKRMIRWME